MTPASRPTDAVAFIEMLEAHAKSPDGAQGLLEAVGLPRFVAAIAQCASASETIDARQQAGLARGLRDTFAAASWSGDIDSEATARELADLLISPQPRRRQAAAVVLEFLLDDADYHPDFLRQLDRRVPGASVGTAQVTLGRFLGSAPVVADPRAALDRRLVTAESTGTTERVRHASLE